MIAQDQNKKIRIELKPQIGTSTEPAKMIIFYGSEIIAEIVASIDYQKGADGRYYPCVALKLLGK